jgi:formylglycine-generating enzyme required for sulfatase activity
MPSRVHLGLLAACGALALGEPSCGPTTLPPLGEVLVIVDTDAPVPNIVSRLRVDAYTADGTWYESRDFLLADPSLWPTSFGIDSATPGQTNTVILRLRAYPDGLTRDYRGERYQARPTGGDPSAIAPLPPPTPGDTPRLLNSSGTDITPPTEPQPLVTIDRFVVLQTTANSVVSAEVVLRGACFGTMANLAAVSTCIDTENARTTLCPPAPVSSNLALPASLNGTFGARTPCTIEPHGAHNAPDGTPLYDEEVCVPGGAFIFGSPVEYGMFDVDEVPERAAIVDPFLMDRYEVTVARWRQAASEGLVHGTPPIANDAAFPKAPSVVDESTTEYCTYSTAPLGREDYPLNCVTVSQARELCQAAGGDLPFEVEWEYAAVQVGRTYKTPYPWGGNDTTTPSCSDAVFGRGYDTSNSELPPLQCLPDGVGPLPVTRTDSDVSIDLGIEKLGGNVGEWTLDALASLGANCWMDQPLHVPHCTDPTGSNAVRGADWSKAAFFLYYGVRSTAVGDVANPFYGFRCVRPGTKAGTP